MIVKIRGNDYAPVAIRIEKFREDFPLESGVSIDTEIVQLDEQAATVVAKIKSPEGVVLASGSARCTIDMARKSEGRYLERAETSAIGRALANAGYNTNAFLNDEDEQYLADAPIERAKSWLAEDEARQNFLKFAYESLPDSKRNKESVCAILGVVELDKFSGTKKEAFKLIKESGEQTSEPEWPATIVKQQEDE